MDIVKYYEEIVSKRHSVREYEDKPVSDDMIAKLEEYFKDIQGITNADIEIKIIDGSKYHGMINAAGYNGFLVEAPKYVLILSDESEHYLENAGYIGQGITLKCTELGLDTCWMTIVNQEALNKALDINGNKLPAALIAFGYGKEQEIEKRLDIKNPSHVKMVETESKAAPKIDLSEFIFDKSYGRLFDESELYTGLEDALLAASRSQSFFNRQPYRIIVDDAEVALIGLKDELTGDYDAHLNYGICMFDFYAVLSATRKDAPNWTFEKWEGDLKLPENAEYVAKCRI